MNFAAGQQLHGVAQVRLDEAMLVDFVARSGSPGGRASVSKSP
jgi:hypothetical protein